MIITDSLNSKKSTLNKFDPIEAGDMLLLDEEDKALVDIMNILNISLVKNRWAPPINLAVDTLKKVYKSMA
jgi:hypothetical protein